MGKHFTNGIDYFNIDCIQEDNLNFIEAKHGLIGYGVVVKLWRKIYMVEGYYTEWTEKNQYLFSKEVGVPVDQVNEIVNTCFQEGLFSQEKYFDHKVLTGSGPQKRWLRIVTESKRKNREIDPKYLISIKTPEKVLKTPEELSKTPDERIQSNVKESKVNKRTVAPAKPAPAKKESIKKEKEAPEPYWKELVKIWFDFGTLKFNVEPSFDGQDPKFLKRIIGRLKQRAAKKNVEWTEAEALKRFKIFLDSAYQDPWLSKHFLLKNLETQFDAVIQQQSAAVAKTKAASPVSNAPAQNSLSDSFDYIKGRFQEGADVSSLIKAEMYDFLVSRNYVPIGFMNTTNAPLPDDKKIDAVIEFLKLKFSKND